jgi:crossover junction endodeoxyribonuclease RusA
MIQIDLPWPSKDLSPNARCHWAVKARAVKKARSEAYLVASTWGPVDAKALDVTLTFYPPDKRCYDDDNLVARAKSLIDGIADALGVDDSRFRLQKPVLGEPIKGGNVHVELRKAA